MHLQDLIFNQCGRFIDNLVREYNYRELSDVSEKNKISIYEMVISAVYYDPEFLEIFMLDDFLEGILSGAYTKSIRDELIERISDLCDNAIDNIIQEFSQHLDTICWYDDPDVETRLIEKSEAEGINRENNQIL